MHIDKGPESGTRCVLQAMKKFTGGLGDDDDREMGDNLVWKKYFTKVCYTFLSDQLCLMHVIVVVDVNKDVVFTYSLEQQGKFQPIKASLLC